VKFEELYNDSQLKIDAIAERILTLNAVPLHTYEDYLKLNEIRIGKNISKDTEAVTLILDSLEKLLVIEREILDKSASINDEGTNSMMSDFITEQEKIMWMFSAWLQE
jgi:starvation-inducible DNA-binding protein